jgi:hypothetical protein
MDDKGMDGKRQSHSKQQQQAPAARSSTDLLV